MTKNSFTDATNAFIKASPWLGPAHMPAVATLRVLAETLDAGDLTPALVAQYGLTYRSLAKLAPTAETTDELEALLTR